MKAKYYEDADLLSFKISNTPFKYAKQKGDVIVHYSEEKEPVLIEIVNATKFLKETTKSLPKNIQQEIYSNRTPFITHRIK